MTTKEDFPEGTLVHVKGHGNDVFRVEYWDSDEDEGEEFCFADSEYSFGDCFRLEDLELVMTAEQANARKVPSADEIVKSLDILGSSWGSTFEVDQTDSGDSGEIYAYARTSDGLKFAFTVKVTQVEESYF